MFVSLRLGTLIFLGRNFYVQTTYLRRITPRKAHSRLCRSTPGHGGLPSEMTRTGNGSDPLAGKHLEAQVQRVFRCHR